MLIIPQLKIVPRDRNECVNECLLNLLGHAIRDLGKESGSCLLITMVFDSGTMCVLGLMVPTRTTIIVLNLMTTYQLFPASPVSDLIMWDIGNN